MHQILAFCVLALAATMGATASTSAPVATSSSVGVLNDAQRGVVDVVRAKQAARPRSFADSKEWREIKEALLSGSRKAAFDAFLQSLSPYLDGGEIGSLSSIESDRGNQIRAQGELATKRLVDQAKLRAQGLAFAALVTGDAQYIRAAKRHLLALAALDPKGSSGVAQEDLSARHVAWTLALGFDWLHSHWSSSEKRALLGAIAMRMEDFAQSLVRGSSPLEKYPLNSHGNEVLGALAEIGVLLAGETPLADRWMHEFIPMYARLLTPFGGNDGGYSNGSSYAVWDAHEYSFRHWDTLRRVLGLDLTQKQWVRNFGNYLTYFVPPGSPVGSFGDGAEVNLAPTWALTAKAYASRVPTRLARWYSQQWFQEDKSSLDLLLMPIVREQPNDYPETQADAVAMPDVGLAAMHSSLRDRGRISLYFRSSPFGAISHAHADQNSFVINARGRRLLIDSGYYDYFGSPHHYEWTKRTKAHNAITFDGGLGQDDPARPRGESSASGRIVAFSTTADMDVVVGDATPAYRGQLTQSKRALVFLKPGIVLVLDQNESALLRSWEWNIHAGNKFIDDGKGNLVVVDQDTKACLSFHSDVDRTFQQSSAFTKAPVRTKAESRPDQWHGYFQTTQRSLKFRSVAVISIDCTPVQHVVEFNPNEIRVELDGRFLTFNGHRVHSGKL